MMSILVYLALLAGIVFGYTIIENDADIDIDIPSSFLLSRLKTMSKHENPKRKFEFLDFLGSGTSGKVYLAASKETSEEYFAVKIFNVKTRRGLAHAVRESHIYKLLNGISGIPRLEGMYLSGRNTLEDIDPDIIPAADAKMIKRDIYRLYKKIKERGVCHNDISLSNVMYDSKDKKVYYIDFGDSRTLFKDEYDFIAIEDDNCSDEENVNQAMEEWAEKLDL